MPTLLCWVSHHSGFGHSTITRLPSLVTSPHLPWGSKRDIATPEPSGDWNSPESSWCSRDAPVGSSQDGAASPPSPAQPSPHSSLPGLLFPYASITLGLGSYMDVTAFSDTCCCPLHGPETTHTPSSITVHVPMDTSISTPWTVPAYGPCPLYLDLTLRHLGPEFPPNTPGWSQ